MGPSSPELNSKNFLFLATSNGPLQAEISSDHEGNFVPQKLVCGGGTFDFLHWHLFVIVYLVFLYLCVCAFVFMFVFFVFFCIFLYLLVSRRQ